MQGSKGVSGLPNRQAVGQFDSASNARAFLALFMFALLMRACHWLEVLHAIIRVL